MNIKAILKLSNDFLKIAGQRRIHTDREIFEEKFQDTLYQIVKKFKEQLNSFIDDTDIPYTRYNTSNLSKMNYIVSKLFRFLERFFDFSHLEFSKKIELIENDLEEIKEYLDGLIKDKIKFEAKKAKKTYEKLQNHEIVLFLLNVIDETNKFLEEMQNAMLSFVKVEEIDWRPTETTPEDYYAAKFDNKNLNKFANDQIVDEVFLHDLDNLLKKYASRLFNNNNPIFGKKEIINNYNVSAEIHAEMNIIISELITDIFLMFEGISFNDLLKEMSEIYGKIEKSTNKIKNSEEFSDPENQDWIIKFIETCEEFLEKLKEILLFLLSIINVKQEIDWRPTEVIGEDYYAL